jgi:uncharacterized membrane protein
MNPVTWIHISAGMAALLLGAVAVAARKGGTVHARAGTGFAVAMIVLGLSATILYRMKAVPESGIGGLIVCYFIATSWVAARRRDGTTGRFEIGACVTAFLLAALMLWSGFAGTSSTPVGKGPIFAFAGIFLLAGMLDLNAILRVRLTAAQRIARHLWRMCFAFFFATGSFFLGQQDVMPAGVRGSPILFLLAFAPFAVMLFWLVRVRMGTKLRQRFEAIGDRKRRVLPAFGAANGQLAGEATCLGATASKARLIRARST